MELIRLTAEYDMKPFNCGDADLNGFLIDDAKPFFLKKLAHTFILEEDGVIVAYFCLLNDKISKVNVANGAWRKVKKNFPHEKHFSSYPSIKIGRFAIASAYKGKGLGSELLSYIKEMLAEMDGYSAFRFLTLDAYLSAIPFYEKNDFKMLLSNDEKGYTRTMYFDMMQMS
ncbi:GNAT family N-acetyltransferase [Bacteroides congonensis]